MALKKILGLRCLVKRAPEASIEKILVCNVITKEKNGLPFSCSGTNDVIYLLP